jgi:hypothetical protein
LQKARPMGAKGIKIRTIAKAREKKLRPRAKYKNKNKKGRPYFF